MVVRRVLRRGSAMGFTVKKEGSEKGSEKGVSRRCLERPLGEYAPLGVRPISGGAFPDGFGHLLALHSLETESNLMTSSIPGLLSSVPFPLRYPEPNFYSRPAF